MNDIVKNEQTESNTCTQAQTFKPWYRVDQKENGYSAEIYLPGASKENVNLRYEDETLIIEAKRSDTVPESWKQIRAESCKGNYLLKLRLNNKIDHEQINANFENGVLRLGFSNKAELAPKQISID
jgi:HSP20 family protein